MSDFCHWRANLNRDSNRDFSTFENSIWSIKIWYKKIAIRFDICFFSDSIRKKLNRDISAACLPDANGMHGSSNHFCFRRDFMPKLHQWMLVIDFAFIATLRTISCAVRPKIYCDRDFLLKINQSINQAFISGSKAHKTHTKTKKKGTYTHAQLQTTNLC